MLFGCDLRWEITHVCNLRCRHCQVGNRLHQARHPDKDHVLRILKRIELSDVANVGLLGGEPLTLPWLDTVVEDLSAKGIAVTINTNGLLIEEQALTSMAKNAFRLSLMISLDGVDAQTHERIRGSGTFATTMRNLVLARDVLKAYGHKIGIACTINQYNQPNVQRMVELARELDLDILQLRTVKAAGNAAKNFQQLAADNHKLIGDTLGFLLPSLLERQGSGPTVLLDYQTNRLLRLACQYRGARYVPNYTGCSGARTSAALDPMGRLWPCQTLGDAENRFAAHFDFCDNYLVDRSFQEIWRGQGFEALRRLVGERRHIQTDTLCGECDAAQLCSPCPLPGLFGKAAAAEPLCYALEEYRQCLCSSARPSQSH
jgi:MoaA/NifB/PqqE/SkfB family radical SAM enzyme